ncbi:hypothetical protein [Butyrivibrio sp. LC3010]|uniref:hypothetical protein n=1 Tax=Butyrivibrio sp. LC3010 TaxID=1280680 RepID=UPI0004098110|nr:hypothetical protein [Butyrivibrio sp. LC3010]
MTLTDVFLQELLRRYQANFDITENFTLGDTTYPAYAWFYSLSEKYVLKKEATLWAIKAFEHVLFSKVDSVSEDTLDDIMTTITNEAEPILVRKNEKYPEKDHMCTYITFIVVSSKDPDEIAQKKIRKFHFDKGYLFNFRGHSEARLAVVSMESGNVWTNYSGRDIKPLLTDAYSISSDIVKHKNMSTADVLIKSVS